MSAVLDNVAWEALTGPHASVSRGDGAARRYVGAVSVFWGAPDDTPSSWGALAELAGPGKAVLLFRVLPQTPPDGWTTTFGGPGHQLVLHRLRDVPALPRVDPTTGASVALRPLGEEDLPAMLDLVERTKPGPFRPRTIDLGGYLGIFHDDVLVSMAGRRMHPPGHREISAVCTDPTAQRRGYGAIVTAAVAEGIRADGEVPFLHVAATNAGARAVYERIGFVHRADAHVGSYTTPE